MFDLPFLFSQYRILAYTAQYLSAVDLYHTALASSDLYVSILQSPNVFRRLKRDAICDGHGLKVRQAYAGPFKVVFLGGKHRKCNYDEEIEMRLFRLTCQETEALPCLKCGVNVCEECRYVPRFRDGNGYGSCPRPHLNPALQAENLIVYCASCDLDVDKRVGDDYCKCNRYTRWICLKCKLDEDKETLWYYAKCTKFDDGSEESKGMKLPDHAFNRLYWCPCGARPSSIANVRCIWCKHLHRTTVDVSDDIDVPVTRYLADYNEAGSFIPYFDDDPCYPNCPQPGQPWWDGHVR